MTDDGLAFSFDHHCNNWTDSNVLNESINSNNLTESEMVQIRETGYAHETQNVKESLISLDHGEKNENDSFKNDMSKVFSFMTSTLVHKDEPKRTKSHLTRHLRIHSSEKPFKCSQCDKFFTRKGDLSMHMRIHSGDLPFQCNHCAKSYTKKSYLTDHLRIHTGERPFKCNQCNKAFRLKGALKKHLMIHSGEIPFLCRICGMGFNRKYNMNKHERTHKKNTAFNNHLCVTADSQDPLKIEMLNDFSSSIGLNEECSFLCNTSGERFDTSRQQIEENPFTNTFQSTLLQGNMDQPFGLEHHNMYNVNTYHNE